MVEYGATTVYMIKALTPQLWQLIAGPDSGHAGVEKREAKVWLL